MNTIRIYETDSHARRLQARVLSCEEGENGWLVELDRTIFYPTGGGQPCDTGTLGGADVTETLLRGETVLHRCTAALPVGADVTGEIDWARRLDLMQQHSGEHLVSGLIHARFGYENVGFHLGTDLVTIDFNGEVDEQALQELERAANEAVWADFAPHIWYPEPDELAHLPYRSKKALTGAVRLVQFRGHRPGEPCCGTHVAHTARSPHQAVQHDAFPRAARASRWPCGGRALAVLNALCAQNRDISVRLSAKPVQTAAAVARLASERTEARSAPPRWRTACLPCWHRTGRRSALSRPCRRRACAVWRTPWSGRTERAAPCLPGRTARGTMPWPTGTATCAA